MSEVAALPGAGRALPTPASAGSATPAASRAVVSEIRAESPLKARECAILIAELTGLWAINKLGYLIVAQLHVSLPGNVAGMVLLFGLLCARIIPPRLFERSSTLLARHLPFFFVPIAVGLMNLGPTVVSAGWLLVLVLVASAAVGLCVTGWLAQLLSRLTGRP
jgi:holin-like protein